MISVWRSPPDLRSLLEVLPQKVDSGKPYQICRSQTGTVRLLHYHPRYVLLSNLAFMLNLYFLYGLCI